MNKRQKEMLQDLIDNKNNQIKKLQQENKQLKQTINKIYELIKQHIRKDEFLELNEWQTRDLLNLLKEVSNKYACLLEKGDSNE